MTTDAHDRLLEQLQQVGADGLSLPSETVGLVLSEAKRLGMPWGLAWNTAVNNVAAPARGGTVDPQLERAIAKDRALLAEVKPAFRAAYEDDSDRSRRDSAIAAKRAEQRLADLDLPTLDEFPNVKTAGDHPAAATLDRAAA